jgi:putative tryptophan/tyrosine transport system substrate-binding protein
VSVALQSSAGIFHCTDLSRYDRPRDLDARGVEMRRREFFGFAGGAASAWAINAFAQQMYRVAVLTPSHTQWQPRTFRDAMQELGYREDVNLNLTVVSGENQLDRMPKLAADLVASAPDVIVAVNTPGTRAAIAATSKIPIVSAIVADPDEPIVALQMQDIERSAPALGIEYRVFPMRTAEDLQRNLQLAAEWNAQAVVRLAGQGFALGSETGRLATERGLPSMLLQKRDVEAGGLMSYFADHRELWRRIAAHVDRLLKGASPRELPFELPTRFELFVNLKTARVLGITLSPLLLARADEVIE